MEENFLTDMVRDRTKGDVSLELQFVSTGLLGNVIVGGSDEIIQVFDSEKEFSRILWPV